jgi:hypothetical protein
MTVKTGLKVFALIAAAASCRPGSEDKGAEGAFDGRPSAASVADIERRMANRPCVGALDQWERLYAFSQKDRNVISFQYREAGRFGFRKGAERRASEDWYNLDDRPYRVVFGSFDQRNSTIKVAYCGLNAPLPPS